MVVLQILAGAFALFALTRVILRAKERKMTWGEMFFWTVVWLMMIVLVILPEASTFFAEHLGIGRGVDLVLYVAIILLFYLLFRLYVKFEQLEQEVTVAVREIALSRLPQQEKKRKG